MTKNLTNKKKKRAYSLAEVIISLAIIGVILTILFNALIIAIQVTNKTLSRSIVREEIGEVTTLISRDVRNADIILNCGDSGSTQSCDLVVNGERISWTQCGNAVCRNVIDSVSGSSAQSFQTSPVLSVTTFSFERGVATLTDPRKGNILFTVVGNHSNERLNITNVVRQVTISTRNYTL